MTTLITSIPKDTVLARLAALVPPGQPLYLSHVPSQSLCEMADLAIAVHRAGLDPVLHLAARLIASLRADHTTQPTDVERETSEFRRRR